MLPRILLNIYRPFLMLINIYQRYNEAPPYLRVINIKPQRSCWYCLRYIVVGIIEITSLSLSAVHWRGGRIWYARYCTAAAEMALKCSKKRIICISISRDNGTFLHGRRGFFASLFCCGGWPILYNVCRSVVAHHPYFSMPSHHLRVGAKSAAKWP